MTRNPFILFGLFVLSILSTCFIFHRLVFTDIPPMDSWEVYIVTKLSVAVLLGSVVFVAKNRWWLVGLSLLLALWTGANWIYYQAYNLFLSWQVIGLAGNMKGYGNSILAFIDYRLLLILLPTLVFLCLVAFFKHGKKRMWWAFAVCMIVGVGLSMRGNYLIHTWRHNTGYKDGDLTIEKLLPLYVNPTRLVQDWESEYSLVQEHSIIAYLPLSIVYDYHVRQLRNAGNTQLTEQEQYWMDSRMPTSDTPVQPKTNLLLILVESLESWALDEPAAMPHTNALRREPNSLYADRMVSQIRYGMSGDGQMIFNTGLLPIESGVACILYGTNRYPSLAEHYPDGIVYTPSQGTWNKGVATYAYGYKRMCGPDQIAWISWNDADIFRLACAQLPEAERPFCIEMLTIASHAPFDRVAGEIEGLPDDTPTNIRRYLTCLHYTDSCIGALIDSLKQCGLYEQTTIAISSDHTIFHNDASRPHYVPLLVVSPEITQSIRITEQCYQMDIYPTLLHLIGCEQAGWRGLGINLADTAAQRHIAPQEAYKLSDKLIRSNYFTRLEHTDD